MKEQEFIDKIKEFEGFRANIYRDPAGVPTIGYGFTSSYFVGGIVPPTITLEDAEKLLKEKLHSVELQVKAHLIENNYVFNDDIVYALTSFTYNCGILNLKKLTCGGLRTMSEISNKITEYCNAGGKKLNGLVKRRQWEKEVIVNAMCETTPAVYATAKDIQMLINRKFGYNLAIDGSIGKQTRQAIFDILSNMC